VTVERGIVYGGRVLPGTDFVLREPGAWWRAGERGTFRMRQPVRRCVWHWTAGGTRTGADAATRVVRAMKARTKPDGSPLSVGIHFVVSWDGIVTQSADLSTGTHHAGNMNDGSIGVELTWPGTEGQARALRVDGGHILPRRTAQGRIDVLAPSDALLDAALRLADALSPLDGHAQIAIPRVTRATTARMTTAQARIYAGHCEHIHAPGSRKIDCAGVICDALAARGYERV